MSNTSFDLDMKHRSLADTIAETIAESPASEASVEEEIIQESVNVGDQVIEWLKGKGIQTGNPEDIQAKFI